MQEEPYVQKVTWTELQFYNLTVDNDRAQRFIVHF